MDAKIDNIRSFNRFYTNFIGLLNEKLLDSPISLTEGRILFEIQSQPKCKAKELISDLRIDGGYLSRTLSKLEKSGLITIENSTEDKRAKALTITLKGEIMLEEIDISASRQIQDLLSQLSFVEQNRLVNAMTDIQTILYRCET